MQTLLSHPYTAVYANTDSTSSDSSINDSSDIPFALQWAFALVRSRAFAAGNDLFAFVPFLDMVSAATWICTHVLNILLCAQAIIACYTVISVHRCTSAYTLLNIRLNLVRLLQCVACAVYALWLRTVVCSIR
jgi:hypothetical protein